MRMNRRLAAGGELAARQAREGTRRAVGDGARESDESFTGYKLLSRGVRTPVSWLRRRASGVAWTSWVAALGSLFGFPSRSGARRVSRRGAFAALGFRWSGTAFFRRAVIAMTTSATQGQHCVEPAVAFDELFVHLVGDYFACAPGRGVTTGSNACSVHSLRERAACGVMLNRDAGVGSDVCRLRQSW